MNTHEQLRALGLFDARVPRYTSYPTAPHFSPAVGADDVRQWLGAMAPGSQISLYVHIPFCRRLCWFCACRTQGTSTDAPVAAYIATLLAELALIRAALPAGVTIGHLHWGGGTPTLLAPDLIATLAGAIFDMAPLAPGGEFSVEIDPAEIDDARMDALCAAGMTRASVGVQDFNPEIQQTIGRIQSFATTKAAVDGLRARGINSLNADILYGLPFQTPQRIRESVEQLLSLAPDRVALFGYAHVPWMARRQNMIPTAALPTPEERLGMFEVARSLFLTAGYDEIGIDHFARKSDRLAIAARNHTLRRNFQGYTDDTHDTLIGLGASAISRYPQGYAQNAPATSAYQGLIRGGRLGIQRGHAFGGDDPLRARIIEALMCDFRVSHADLAARFGTSGADFATLADGAATAFPGMLDTTGGAITIRPHARPLTRIIARHFDAYAMEASGHSSAV